MFYTNILSKKISQVFLIFLILALYSCGKDEQNTETFNELIISYYEKNCSNQDSCIIHLAKETSFNWDKMYIFSNEHYPEADKKIIRKITGTDYSGNRDFLENRSILFTKGNKVVYEILTPYDVDGYIDTKSMYLGFVNEHDLPEYIPKEKSNFLIIPNQNSTGYSLEYLK